MIENRYKGIRTPHKMKFGVSGCTRECAEAQGKDLGIIATDAGWNMLCMWQWCSETSSRRFIGKRIRSWKRRSNTSTVLQMFYIRTVAPLQRTFGMDGQPRRWC